MDPERIRSVKQRLEDNKSKLSRLSFRENYDEAKDEPDTSNTNRFDYIFKIVIIGDAVKEETFQLAETELCL